VHTYQDLLDRSATLAAALLGDENDLNETRVALVVSPDLNTPPRNGPSGARAVSKCHLPVGDDTGVGVRPDGLRCGHLDVGYSDAAKISPMCERLGVRLVNVESVTPHRRNRCRTFRPNAGR